MKLLFQGTFRFNTEYLMRRCGYGRTANRSGEVSYVKVLGRSGYPRFHAYIESLDNGFTVNMHLDQKKPSYGEHTAHSGEYDGLVVEQEAARITQFIHSMKQ